MSMELTVKEVKGIPEGLHKGVIDRIESRDVILNNGETASYVDVCIKTEGDVIIRYGSPKTLSEKSKLGKLVSKFTDLKAGKTIDVEGVLVGKKVSFVTFNTENGFARISEGSLKPCE